MNKVKFVKMNKKVIVEKGVIRCGKCKGDLKYNPNTHRVYCPVCDKKER